MSASSWAKLGSYYATYGHRIRGTVYQIGETWFSKAYVDNEVIYHEEWPDRETALQNCGGAMGRACFFRRFEKDPPIVADTGPDDDEDEDDEDA